MTYAGAVFGVMFTIHGADGLVELGKHTDLWKAQAMSFFVMTLPFLLYFAVFESRSRPATPGKRIVGLRVMGVGGTGPTFGRALARAAIKFLPWEVGHVFANQMFAHSVRTPDAPVPWWFWLLFVVSMGGALLYAASLFLGEGTTPYDRLTGTQVRRDG